MQAHKILIVSMINNRKFILPLVNTEVKKTICQLFFDYIIIISKVYFFVYFL